MRTPSLFSLSSGLMLALAAACGTSSGGAVDAHGGSGSNGDATPDGGGVPPRIIAGGGIGDGPITGVANVYVIDDASRQPVAGAAVTVGTVTGVTDATGLFVATGVTGKQTVLVTAGSYRGELWVGANGANLTVDLQPANAATPGSATLTGSVDLSSFSVAVGHQKTASVTYSQDELATDAANNLDQGGANTCSVGAVAITQSCGFTVTSRTGHVALIAAVFDHDPKTADPTDDTFTLIGWAQRPSLVVANGVAQTGQDLAVVTTADTVTEKVAFAPPPTSLPLVAGIIGIDLGPDGVLELPSILTSSPGELVVPKLSVFATGTYRLSGVAKASAADDSPTSVVFVRAQTGTQLTAPDWLLPSTNASVTRATASWTAVDNATVQGIEYAAGATQLLSATSFDGTTTIDIPAAAGLPATGALTAKITAIEALGLDVNNFGLDADRAKITAVAAAPTQVAN